MRKVFSKLDRETAVEIRARLDGLEEHPGYAMLMSYLENQANELRKNSLPLTSNDFAAVNSHNRRIYRAETFEEVRQWVQDAKDQCETLIQGERK